MSEVETVGDLLTQAGFRAGFAAGLVLLALLYMASRIPRIRVYGWALGGSIAIVSIVSAQHEIDVAIVLALVAVAIGGLIFDVANTLGTGVLARVLKAAAAVLGVSSVVWFTTTAYQGGEQWIEVAFPVVTLLTGVATLFLSRSGLGGLVSPMIAISVLGIWVTIPETDMFTIAVGVSLPLAAATLPPVRSRTSAMGALTLAALLVWLTIVGGEPRPISIMAGWGSLGTIGLFSILASLGCPLPGKPALVALHVVYVVVVTRVVDIWDSTAVVLTGIVIMIVATGLALLLWPGARSRPAAADSRSGP